jgi:hypothetical protein
MTANKLYKESRSNLSFKLWLKENQTKGILDNHEKMFNLMGVDENTEEEEEEDDDDKIEKDASNGTSIKSKTIPTKKSPTTKVKGNMGILNVVGIIGLGILLYGLANAKAE